MPFTSKLRTEYVELVNHYLDNIPLETPEGFPVVSEALKAITEPNQSHRVPPSLEGRLKDLKEMLEEPEMYVEDRADDQEFKNIILQRVSRKIEELDQLGDVEKKRYIAFQKEQKKQAIENHSEMAKHKPPEEGSPAHTGSEEVIAERTMIVELSEEGFRVTNSLFNRRTLEHDVVRLRVPFSEDQNMRNLHLLRLALSLSDLGMY